MTDRTRSSARIAALATAILVFALPVSARAAEDLRLEAEEFEGYGSYNIGGSDIRATYCSYASGGLAVDGLDTTDEWIKLKVTFPRGGCFTSRLDYQSAYGDTVELVVRLLDYPSVGEELRSDYTLSGGYGFG